MPSSTTSPCSDAAAGRPARGRARPEPLAVNLPAFNSATERSLRASARRPSPGAKALKRGNDEIAALAASGEGAKTVADPGRLPARYRRPAARGRDRQARHAFLHDEEPPCYRPVAPERPATPGSRASSTTPTTRPARSTSSTRSATSCTSASTTCSQGPAATSSTPRRTCRTATTVGAARPASSRPTTASTGSGRTSLASTSRAEHLRAGAGRPALQPRYETRSARTAPRT